MIEKILKFFLFFLIRKSQLFLYNNLSFLILTLWTVLKKKKKKFSTHTIQKGNKQASGEEAATAAKSKVKNGKKIVQYKKKFVKLHRKQKKINFTKNFVKMISRKNIYQQHP